MAYLGLLILGAALEILTTPVVSHAVAVPVPEPATIVLVGVGVGVAGLGAWVKRRRTR